MPARAANARSDVRERLRTATRAIRVSTLVWYSIEYRLTSGRDRSAAASAIEDPFHALHTAPTEVDDKRRDHDLEVPWRLRGVALLFSRRREAEGSGFHAQRPFGGKNGFAFGACAFGCHGVGRPILRTRIAPGHRQTLPVPARGTAHQSDDRPSTSPFVRPVAVGQPPGTTPRRSH